MPGWRAGSVIQARDPDPSQQAQVIDEALQRRSTASSSDLAVFAFPSRKFSLSPCFDQRRHEHVQAGDQATAFISLRLTADPTYASCIRGI